MYAGEVCFLHFGHFTNKIFGLPKVNLPIFASCGAYLKVVWHHAHLHCPPSLPSLMISAILIFSFVSLPRVYEQLCPHPRQCQPILDKSQETKGFFSTCFGASVGTRTPTNGSEDHCAIHYTTKAYALWWNGQGSFPFHHGCVLRII